MGVLLIAIILMIIFILIGFAMNNSEESFKEYEKRQLEQMKNKDNYNKKHKIPINSKLIKYINGNIKIDEVLKQTNRGSSIEFHVWKDENILKFVSVFQNDNNEIIYNIAINNIISFDIIGDSYVETNVSGGGSSVKGAVVGGVIAGGTGAIIGSRKGIKTENKYIDKRKTVMIYKNNMETKSMFFSSNAYEVLLNLIPNKCK